MKNLRDYDIAYVGVCPYCGQGRQFVARENSTERLFILCEECEAEWDTPSDARDVNLITLDKYGACSFVGVDELREHPWFPSVVNQGVA